MAKTLKGKWYFNEVLTMPATSVDCRGDEQGSTEFFTSNSRSYVYLACYGEDSTDPWMLMYGWGGKFPYGTKDTTIGWADEADRVIEFLFEVEVSDAFYEWFTANAISLTIKGKWKFNETLVNVGNLSGNEYINFTTASGSHGGFNYLPGELWYWDWIDGQLQYMSAPPVISGDTVYRPELLTIDFGSEPQSVSEDFYRWFIANAVQIETVSGKWRFNKELTIFPSSRTFEEVTFNSNGVYYEGFYIDFLGHQKIWYKAPNYNPVSLVYNTGDDYPIKGWQDEVYRTIEFTQEIVLPEGLEEWFHANARPLVQKLYTELYVSDIADAIRKQTGGEETYSIQDMALGVQRACEKAQEGVVSEVGLINNELEQTLYGIDTGGKSFYDEFWDAFQKDGNRAKYHYAFFQWGGDTIRPKYKVAPTDVQSLNQTFCESKVKKIESAYFDFSQKVSGSYDNNSAYYTFNSCTNLEEIEDIGLFESFKYYATFSWSKKLHTIAKMRVAETTKYQSVFNGCSALENLTIEGVIGQDGFSVSDCKKLSADSIRNIIEHLSDTASGKTLTLSKTAVNNAFTTDEWTALAATKKNWTISLA